MTVRKRSVAVMMLVTLLAGFAVNIASPAQADVLWRGMRNRGTGLCIDNATEDPRKVQSWKCSISHPAQQWNNLLGPEHGWFVIRNANTGRCLDVIELSVDFVRMEACDYSFQTGSQLWTVFYALNQGGGWFQLWRSVTTGRCLGGLVGNGSLLVTHPCSSLDTTQRWSFVEP